MGLTVRLCHGTGATTRRSAGWLEHALNEEELKPYFQLDAMLTAAFDCANRLFELEFAELDVDLYHDDVRAWNVTRRGEHVAVLIGDYFNRSGKRSGAWCGAWRSQQKLKAISDLWSTTFAILLNRPKAHLRC